MPQELATVMKACRARLARTAAAESVAVAVTAGALAAAMAEVAWAVAQVHPVTAAAIALGGGLVGALSMFRPVRRALALTGREAALCAVVTCAIGLASAACCLAGWTGAIDRLTMLAIALFLAGLAGALASYLQPVSLLEAAIYVDSRCGLEERLATAAELAGSPEAESPPAMTVYEQAIIAAKQRDVLHASLWRRTRATAGAMGLAILLCTTLLLVPTFKPVPAGIFLAGQVAAGLDDLSPQKKRQLVDAFRKAATQPVEAPAVRQALNDAAKAAVDDDPKALENALAILERAGYKLQPILPAGVGPGGAGARKPSEATSSPASQPAHRPAASAGEQLVRVMNPEYRNVATSVSQGRASPPAEMLQWDNAWDIARARAADALSGGQVPSQYRQLVRDFFDTGESPRR